MLYYKILNVKLVLQIIIYLNMILHNLNFVKNVLKSNTFIAMVDLI